MDCLEADHQGLAGLWELGLAMRLPQMRNNAHIRIDAHREKVTHGQPNWEPLSIVIIITVFVIFIVINFSSSSVLSKFVRVSLKIGLLEIILDPQQAAQRSRWSGCIMDCLEADHQGLAGWELLSMVITITVLVIIISIVND